MPRPLDVARFVQLITQQPLEAPAVWYRCVQRHAPPGVVVGVPAPDRPTTVQLVHRVSAGRHGYVVPVSRDLTIGEVDAIVHAFAARRPDLDFEVETNETRLTAHDGGAIPLDAAQHAATGLALAKQQHEDWVRKRSDAGWRYGTRFDQRAKTHPLLRPWDQLPSRFQAPVSNP